MPTTSTDEELPRPRYPTPRSPESELYQWYAAMRRSTRPSYDSKSGCWNVFTYADAQRVVQDGESFASDLARADVAEVRGPIQASLVNLDRQRHQKVRAHLAGAFTPQVVAALAPRIAALVDALLDAAVPRGRLDVIADLAHPLPATVIAELLGVPPDAVARFSPAAPELGGFFAAVVAERRRRPTDDLIGALVRAEIDGERLTEAELVGCCVLLLVAGSETTTNLIGNAVHLFAAQPDLLDRLRAEPALMPLAVEEVLRYLSPVQMLPHRIARQPVEVGGARIEAGQRVAVWIGSANRDEARFEDAERFVADRSPNPHLAFGAGRHYCLGAALARLEAQIALSRLLDRCPRLVVDEAGAVLLSGPIVFGYRRLPVALWSG